MAKRIVPSSFACDCGCVSHFGVRPIREMEECSLRRHYRNKPIGLRTSEPDGHSVQFVNGKATAVICPKLGSCPITGWDFDYVQASHHQSEPVAKKVGTKMTHRQGQFLAFIHLFRKLHRRAPAELDMAKFFMVTPPSVHGMVVQLAKRGLITRVPGAARSIEIAVPAEDIPELEDSPGPPW